MSTYNDNNNSNNNSNSNNHHYTLSHDERTLLTMYQNFYDQTTLQINELYRTQSEIRENIQAILRNHNNFSTSETQNNINNNENQTSINNHHGIPYIFEYQHEYIPYRSTNTANINTNTTTNTTTNTSTNINENQRTRPNLTTSYNNIFNNLLGSFSNPNINSNLNTNNFLNNYNSGIDFMQNLQQFYSNVPIIPTNQQIIDGTRITLFNQIINPNNNSCPISLENFEDNSSVTQIRGCGHIFTSNSIHNWFRTNPRCPVCRYDIRDYIIQQTENPITSSFSNINQEVEQQQQEEEKVEQRDLEYDEESELDDSLYDQPMQNNYEPINTLQTHNDEPTTISNTNANTNTNTTPLPTQRRLSTSNLTGMLVSQLISSVTGNRFDINDPNYYYDSSNNEIIFENIFRNREFD